MTGLRSWHRTPSIPSCSKARRRASGCGTLLVASSSWPTLEKKYGGLRSSRPKSFFQSVWATAVIGAMIPSRLKQLRVRQEDGTPNQQLVFRISLTRTRFFSAPCSCEELTLSGHDRSCSRTALAYARPAAILPPAAPEAALSADSAATSSTIRGRSLRGLMVVPTE